MSFWASVHEKKPPEGVLLYLKVEMWIDGEKTNGVEIEDMCIVDHELDCFYPKKYMLDSVIEGDRSVIVTHWRDIENGTAN